MLKGEGGIAWLREQEVPFLCVRGDGSVENAFENRGA
jgi:hypothetical protein